MIEFAQATEQEICVAEISSYQLETLQSLRPHIAMVLNITEDHLNRHYNMENYVFLKSKLLKNCTEAEYAVLNYDDPIVKDFAEKVSAGEHIGSSSITTIRRCAPLRKRRRRKSYIFRYGNG